MKKKALIFLLAAALVMCVFVNCEESGKDMSEYESLYTLAEPYGFKLGGCLSYSQLSDKAYLALLARHFNSVTCTNETKAYSLLDQTLSKLSPDGMPRMNYTQADKMLAWAQQNGLGVRGHVLVWDAYMTEWFFHVGYNQSMPLADTETVRLRLKSYIEQVITHFETKFPGVIYCWDVVNEAIGDSPAEYDPGDPRHIRTVRSGVSNIFLDTVGSDYVEYSFLCARNAVQALGADIKLFYNDYNMFSASKVKAACALTESINSYAADENGAYRTLIDGIGMQGYIGGYGTQSGCLSSSDISSIKSAILTYASLGVEVQLTEMAVRNYELSKAPQHAEYYGRLFSMLMSINTPSSAPLTAVTIWGMNDIPVKNSWNEYSWKLNSPYGGLFTEKNKVKTSFESVYAVLGGK